MSTPRTDHELLRAHAERRDDAAFGELVTRHADMVYAAAVRQVGRQGGLAEDVTQATFILLSRKAGAIREGVVIAAWLHKATRYAALNAMKIERRRRAHERTAGERLAAETLAAVRRPSGANADVNWAQGAALLDEGVAKLGGRDREAVVLRFLERRSFAEVGRALGVSEEAAQMRVGRAVEKLRGFFRRRGLIVGAATLRAAVNANAVVPAPAAFKLTLAPAATGAAAPSLSATLLAEAAGRSMLWASLRSNAPATASGMAVAAALALLLLRMFGDGGVARGPAHPIPPATRPAIVAEDRRPAAARRVADGPPAWATRPLVAANERVHDYLTPRPLIEPPRRE